MQIHHGPQVASLPLFSSGGLLVPTPLPQVSPRVLLEDRRLLLSPQQGRRPPIGSSLSTPLHGFHSLIWIYANVAVVACQWKLPLSLCAHCPPLICLNFTRFLSVFVVTEGERLIEREKDCGNTLRRSRFALSQGFTWNRASTHDC